MAEPTITCPKCKAEIKLTESLAAPLVESTRREYEKRLTQKDVDLAARERSLTEGQTALSRAKENLEAQVAQKLQQERATIAAEEAKKAKLLLAADLDQKAKELLDLQEILNQRDQKLAEAQHAQAELLKKQRELEDAKRELDLTVERRVRENLATARQQVLNEAEERLKLKMAEKEQTIASMQNQIGEFTRKEAVVADREKSIRQREEALSTERKMLEDQLAQRLQQERTKIAAEEAGRAKLAFATDLNQKAQELHDLQEILKSREEKLAEAQKTQADLLKKQRELDDAKRELDLTVEKRIQEGLGATRQQARKEAEDELKLKVAEKEQTIASMQRQIEDLKRKAEQGSQQLQGEVQELQLETLLKAQFPRDTIDPVPKGEHGGDILHRVLSPLGAVCGTILWESKRTKNWNEGWLPKLRDDQRTAKAEIAIVVSQALPAEVETFGLIDGVFVTNPTTAIPVAVLLRHSLIETAMARQAAEGQQSKMEMVYQYLTGPRFRHRVQALVEAFGSMKEDLDRERKAIQKQWAKRDEQIGRVLEATVGMYGDLQGIAGKSIQEIDGLEFKALEDTKQSNVCASSPASGSGN